MLRNNGDAAPSNPPSPSATTTETSSASAELALVQTCEYIELEATEDYLSAANLASFLCTLPAATAREVASHETVLCARATVFFHMREFASMKAIISNYNFSVASHHKLQRLWRETHYLEAEEALGRPLGRVDKCRVRKQFPLPRTIWDGEQEPGPFEKWMGALLLESFLKDPRPSLGKMKELAIATGLSPFQVGNWFGNQRIRENQRAEANRRVNQP